MSIGGGGYGDCPRCGAKMKPRGGMPQCSGCSSVWLDSVAFAEEWEVKNRKVAYLSDGFAQDLTELIGMTRTAAFREMYGYLETTHKLVEEQYKEMKSAVVARGADIDFSSTEYTDLIRKLGEEQALRTVVEWLGKLTDKLEAGETGDDL